MVDQITTFFEILELPSYDDDISQLLLGQYIRAAHGCICVVDVCDVSTLGFLRQVIPKAIHFHAKQTGTPFVVAINKMDLDVSKHRVTVEMARDVIRDCAFNYSIVETSAKTGCNVLLAFEEVARRVRMNSIRVTDLIVKVLMGGKKSKKKQCLAM